MKQEAILMDEHWQKAVDLTLIEMDYRKAKESGDRKEQTRLRRKMAIKSHTLYLIEEALGMCA